MQELVDKYKVDKNPLRLTILLETYNKKATKPNIAAVKLLIDDDDMKSLQAFLGLKEGDLPLVVPTFPHNQDDFTDAAKKVYGQPDDKNSLGNKILAGIQNKWLVQSYFPPDKLLRRWASIANHEMVEVDFFTNHKNLGVPVWDCCILGTHEIKRTLYTKVAGSSDN